jgi:hypothetical protein
MNGSGKSVLINYIACTGYRCQRLLVDTKDEFRVPDVEPVSDPDAIDWQQPFIHYVDSSGDKREYDKLFRACMTRRQEAFDGPRTYGLVVVVHELADLCGDSPGATPQWVNAYIRKGRAHGLGLLAGSQRPVNLPKIARTESQHVFAFAPGFDPDDRPVVARCMGINEAELAQLLRQAWALSPNGQHSYLWYDRRARTIAIRPPLPEHLRARVSIRSLEP